jgi:Spy/CpxP family protein refolding chaperone
MKKILVIAASFFLLSNALYAQSGQAERMNKGERKEKVEAMKIAYLTNQLDLTPAEAQQFWPVFNEYETKIQAIRQSRRKDKKEGSDNLDQLTDKEVEALIDSEVGFRQKELDVLKEYHAKFKAVLPIRKVAKLYRAQEDFKRELLKKIQERKGEKRP